MLQAMNLAKILIYDVGISHRNLNTRMTKKPLGIDDIRIVSK